MNLYVSNLTYALTDDELRSAFEAYGQVSSARVVLDRETGRSRGFGFVEMPDDNEATAALNALNGQDIGGRAAKVVIARPKEERPGGFGGAPRRDFGGAGGAPRPNFGGGGGGRSDKGGGGGRRDAGGGGRDKDRGWDRDRRSGRSGGGFQEDDAW